MYSFLTEAVAEEAVIIFIEAVFKVEAAAEEADAQYVENSGIGKTNVQIETRAIQN
jgi:hypothetical protein